MINFKRFISAILSLVMVMFMFESIPVYAKTGTETYTYEDYTIDYSVSNEWTGHQSVEVKITNTGEESILNWALKYDAKGEISGLWNAVSVSNQETAYLIKNSGYNYEIAPDESVSFGYTLSGENLSVPEKFELCSKRVDTKEENYTAVLDITEEWDTGFKAELIVSNVSDSPIEAWQFSFDSNFTVSDIWDCRLLENTDGRYTVASEAWINPIQPGSSVTIGIVGTKTEGQEVNISDISLSEVVIDDTLPEVQEPVGEMFIVAFGEYIKDTETIDILWMSTQTEGTFEILMSDDNEEYTVTGSVQNADNYSIPADFVKKYIKVRQTNVNQTAESEPFVVMMTPTGYTVDFIDSDNDGLYDYIEDSVGTDKNLSDTDSDNLSDYEEVYILGTDPLVYDSIVSGTSDGDADPDNDGLSNRYELDNGTNPLCDDTDSDSLTDGEEIGTYGTDPVKYDTDEDNIGDGDEITLGLNPLDSSTDGTPDSERIFEQKITSDSDIMSHINTEDNAFSMSIDISAAGNAENSISVSESGYSAVIQSDAVLGTIPEISYASGLSVEEVRVNFEIKDEYLENTLGTYSDCEELSGIKRLNIFRYFEEENILLPIETKFDIENNMVYTDVDMVGTYCLIDMEKWFESIGVDFESESDSVETYSELQTMSFDEMQMLNDNSDDISVDFDKIYDKDGKNVIQLMYLPYIKSNLGFEYRKWLGMDLIEQHQAQDVVYEHKLPVLSEELFDKLGLSQTVKYVDVVVFSAVHSKNYKSEMLNGKWIINKFKEMEYLYGNIHFYVYSIDGTVIKTKTGKEYAETLEEVKDIVSNVDKHSFVGEKSNLVLENAFEFYKNKDIMYDISLLNDILYLGDFKDNYYRWDDSIRIDMKYGGLRSGNTLYEETDKELNRMIFNNIILANQNPVIFVAYCYYKPEEKPLQIITATGLKPLPMDFDSKADYDDDGLLNTEEIDWNSPLIKDKSLKTYESLPTVQECIGYKKELTYVENGLKRLQTLPGNVYSELITKRILPINSDPLSVDGDEDGLLDNDYQRNDNGEIIAPIDEHPLKIDGPVGAWGNHIENARRSDIPTTLKDWYGYTRPVIEQPNYGAEGFFAFKGELDYLEEQGKLKLSDSQKNMILTFSAPFVTGAVLSLGEMGKNVDDNIALNTSKISFSIIMATIESGITNENERDEIMASLGSRLLNFKSDNQGVIHSQNKQWQLIGGYNNLYDNVFREYTNYTMRNEKFAFTVDNFEYILWIWRGNYLNLGAGAEMGLYYRPTILPSDPDGLDHYFAHSEIALPMQLYLYDYESGKNIFSWRPTDDQWWITGFNPECKGEKADAKNQVMIGSVQFRNGEMYEKIKNTSNKNSEDYNIKSDTHMIFDDAHKTVWIMWYEESLVR